MITAALLGNPNVGKTTLFNQLTGSDQYVGNWAGVTIDKKEGYLNNSVKIVDLPGIYALDTFSNEEKVSKAFLQNEKVDVILNIVDASNLERNLYLTTQLKQFNKPIVLIINMVDVLEKKGCKIDYSILSNELKVIVIPIIAAKNLGIDKVKELLKSSNFLSPVIDNDYQFQNERDSYIFIENVLNKCLISSCQNTVSISDKIDRIILNKFLAYPIFILIMFLIFEFTFSWVGQPLAKILSDSLNYGLVPILKKVLSSSSTWFQNLIINGIVGGVGSVIVFFPVILALFLGITFLEESGYMARAAFIMDKFMRRIGLSGKAFIPLVIGFGCSVPAIMSARTLESEKDRNLTALIVPLMSCNARLPVYALFASAFFPKNASLVVASLYFIGILMSFLIGLLFKNTIFKKNEEPFIIELPQYKFPQPKSLLKNTWEKGKGFIKKAGTIIFSFSIIIWILSNFNFSGVSDLNSSFLANIGSFISPLFKPMGFGNWKSSVALLSGLAAKEMIVDTLGVIYGGNLINILPKNFSPLSAYSFLVFVLLYTPCISVIVTMKKEYGNKMAAFSVAYQIVLAWIASFSVFSIGTLFLKFL